MFTQTVTTQWSGNGESLVNTATLQAQDEDFRDVVVLSGTIGAPATANFDLDLIPANIKLLVLASGNDVTLTPYDNSSTPVAGTPILVKGGAPYIWSTSSGSTNPLAGSNNYRPVKFTVTNTSGSATVLKVRVLFDNS